MVENLSKLMCEIVFAGDLDINPDGCAAALQAAGFEVARMEPRHRKLMAVEGDEFMEALGTGTDVDSFWEKVQTIVEPFGGDVNEGGEIGDDHVPLQSLHDQEARLAQQV
jgi:hypothetical protein